MKTGQLYRLTMSAVNALRAEAGNMIFLAIDSDEVIGFIESVNPGDNTMDMCLFQQSPNLPDDAEIIEETLSPNDVHVLFMRMITTAPPTIQNEWSEDAEFADYATSMLLS